MIASVEDSLLNSLGGLECAKEIWELAIIPALLNNAETFSIQNRKVFKLLEDFQSKLWRGLLAVGKSRHLPSLTYESNSMLMKYRVYSRVLNLAKHIYSQDEELNLSKQVMSEQIKNKWSGLTIIAEQISEEINISGLFDPSINKRQFKSIVKKACLQMNNDELKTQISTYKKMSAIREEVQKGNEYFFREKLSSARTIFRFRADLFPAKMNFKNKPDYKEEKFLCDSCMSETDHNTHVLHCPSYKTLREDKNLNNDNDLAEYLQKVIEIRTKLRLDR